MAFVEIEANTDVANIIEPGLSDAGDRNVVSNVSSNSSMFLKEPCASLILVLLPGHSKPHGSVCLLLSVSRSQRHLFSLPSS